MLASVADRGVSERRLRVPRKGQEFAKVLHRQRRVGRQHHLRGDERGDRGEVFQRIDRQVRIQMRADDDLAVLTEEQGVAVWGGLRRELAREVAVGPRPVLDNYRLAEGLA